MTIVVRSFFWFIISALKWRFEVSSAIFKSSWSYMSVKYKETIQDRQRVF